MVRPRPFSAPKNGPSAVKTPGVRQRWPEKASCHRQFADDRAGCPGVPGVMQCTMMYEHGYCRRAAGLRRTVPGAGMPGAGDGHVLSAATAGLCGGAALGAGLPPFSVTRADVHRRWTIGHRSLACWGKLRPSQNTRSTQHAMPNELSPPGAAASSFALALTKTFTHRTQPNRAATIKGVKPASESRQAASCNFFD
jgi:hypothetical protein